MAYYVGLDVSLHETTICVMNAAGDVVREGVVESEAKAIIGFLRGDRFRYHRVGLEAGAMAAVIFVGLEKARLPVICIEARHAHKVLSARMNKTDRNDSLGIADLMRTNTFRPVHIKGDASQQARTLLGARRLLMAKVIDMENGIGGLLRALGIKIGRIKRTTFRTNVTTRLQSRNELKVMFEPLLTAWQSLYDECSRLDAQTVRTTKADPICQLLMTAQGVGPVVALTYRSVIDDPTRFKKSKTVGAYLGLTPVTRQSGEMDIRGRSSRRGDKRLRTALVNAAVAVLNPRTGPSDLRSWGLSVAAKRGMMKANIAVARRLAVILHRMWISDTPFRAQANLV